MVDINRLYLDSIAKIGEFIVTPIVDLYYLASAPIIPLVSEFKRGYARTDQSSLENLCVEPTNPNISEFYRRTIGLPFYYSGRGSRKLVDVIK